MDEITLIEDILTTKNTLTILHRVYLINKISLEQFSSIFNSIAELIDILAHSSVKQIEIVLLSTESKLFFNKLKDILNDLSDAITTKNTLIINSLNEKLSESIKKLRICSSHTNNNEETADDIFQKQLLQQRIDLKGIFQSQQETYHSLPHLSEYPDSFKKVAFPLTNRVKSKSPAHFSEKQKPSSINPFGKFRFARQQRLSSSSAQDDESSVVNRLNPPPPPQSKPSSSVEDFNFDQSSIVKPRLMISYNHASKPLCVEIYNLLTNDGYKVWIDFQEMHGNTLVAMAQAIEESDIILYCITENYSQSRSCQKEAEYAFIRQKIMIPLLLQTKYKPTGWLGFLLGVSLYIDFTKNDFTQNYKQLKDEIQANTIRINTNENDLPKLTLNSTTNNHSQPLTKTSNTTKSRGCILL